jgi:hypothetical protein
MKPFNTILLFVLLILYRSPEVLSQVSISNTGGVPDSSAMLDIKSDNKGLLLPRIDYNNRPLNPAPGLLIYVLSNGPFGNGLYIFDGSGWLKIVTNIYHLGEYIGGGIIFYLDSTGQHGLISCSADQTPHPYGCDTLSLIGAGGTAIGTGDLNTAAIVAACPPQDIAALVCDTSTQGGFTDWFLPSRDELDSLSVHQALVGGFNSSIYWSSSEVSNVAAWVVNFNPAYPWLNGWTTKFGYFSIRCVRKF